MKREELSATDSVAELFKVTTARARRRLVRREDPVDWELLAQILDAAFRPQPEPWPVEPLDALIMIVLAGLRPGDDTLESLKELFHKVDGKWASLLDPTIRADELGLTTPELGHLRTVLRFVLVRFEALTLEPLREMTDSRALRSLNALPGMDLSLACTLLLRSFGRQVLPPTPEVRRVLMRMGVLPAGLSETESLNHLQRIPVGVAIETLLYGMTILAQKTCPDVDPNCMACPLVTLCDRGRKGTMRGPVTEAMTVVDLFAGAGGMSLGLAQAGLRSVLAVELDEWACETYRANHPELPRNHVLCGDIRKMDPAIGQSLIGSPRPDLVVGGPPCQGFSLIGKRGRSRTRFIDDPRNKLYKEYIRWIGHLRPRFVVMENVPGLYSFADGAIRKDIEANLQELGYAVDDLVVDASRFGVPQRRQRVIFIGASVTDFGERAVHMVQRITGLLRERADAEVTLREAIGDLPSLDAGGGLEASLQGVDLPTSTYVREMGADRTFLMTRGTEARGEVEGLLVAEEVSPYGPQQRILFHHSARPINLRDKLLYARLKPGETAGDAMEQGARHLMVYRNDVFHDKYRRLRYDEPAPTIMSHLAKDGHMFIHPDTRQRRSITVREAARIQSFPDDFLFLGPRTAQFTQVGNAVPPKLARAIGKAIMQALAEVRDDDANHPNH